MLAAINAASSGTNEIVAAKTGMTIRVLSYVLVVAGEVVVTWKSATDAISGAMTLIKGTPLVAPAGSPSVIDRPAHLETAPSEALNLSLGGAVQVSGHLEYEYRLL